jgi:hypothetical protein
VWQVKELSGEGRGHPGWMTQVTLEKMTSLTEVRIPFMKNYSMFNCPIFPYTFQCDSWWLFAHFKQPLNCVPHQDHSPLLCWREGQASEIVHQISCKSDNALPQVLLVPLLLLLDLLLSFTKSWQDPFVRLQHFPHITFFSLFKVEQLYKLHITMWLGQIFFNVETTEVICILRS